MTDTATSPSFRCDLGAVILAGEARGDDPDTVFIHGFADDLHGWDAVWAALGNDFPALRYDLRGFGGSLVAAPCPFSHGDDLIALLDARGIAQADLVGVSMGGSIALQCALDHPERVGRLVLISPDLMGWDWSEEWRALWQPITLQARAGNMDAAKRLWLDHPLFASVRGGRGEAALQAAVARYSGAEWVQDWQRDVMPDVERLPLLQVPTLLLTGERDMADFRLIADLIAGASSLVERIDVAECGHMLSWEAPELCAAAIRAFLADSAA